MAEKERVEAYLDTVERLEPKIAFTDADAGAYGTSAAVSLKRIADSLETLDRHLQTISDYLSRIP